MNNNNFNIENYFLKPNSSIEWLALIKPGEPVLDDHNWVCSKKDNYPLFDGYQAARIVKNKDGKYLGSMHYNQIIPWITTVFVQIV